MNAQGRSRCKAPLILYVCCRWLVDFQHHAPSSLPLGKHSVPIEQETAWILRSVETGAENLVRNWVRALKIPGRSVGRVTQWGRGEKFGQTEERNYLKIYPNKHRSPY